MNRSAYIAGKIDGSPMGYVKDKFNFIANRLTRMGYRVVKPVAVTDDLEPCNDVLHSDIKNMIACDEVHLLPDWQESLWARFERDLALRMGIHVVYH